MVGVHLTFFSASIGGRKEVNPMRNFLLDLAQKALEAFIIALALAIATRLIPKKCSKKKRTTFTPRKRNKGGSKCKK